MADEHEQSPAWKFWAPLSFGKVLLIFLIANVATQLLAAALREGLGLEFMTAGGAGAGGALVALLIINAMVRKQSR